MTELLTAAQMRAIEAAAIESGEVTGLELMERAGQGVVEAIFAEWPELEAAQDVAHSAVVLCGPGNNGGDGFVVARLLKARGWEVSVFLYGAAERLPPDAKANYERWCELGTVAPLSAAALGNLGAKDHATLLVDGLFGTGLVRPVDLPLRALTGGAPEGQTPRVVAIDLPTGICSDSGRVIGAGAGVVRADLTVSFHQNKLGHFLADGPEHCGKVAVKDIGLSRPRAARSAVGVNLVVPAASGKPAGHKYSHGHALVLSGGSGKTGAARMAARGALRIGTGIVTLGVPPAALVEAAAQLTAVMLRKVEDAVSLADALEDKRITTLCIGPGMGLQRVRNLLPEALKCGRGCVFDAGALTAYEGRAQQLFDMLHENCVLTPHAGEFARLFPDLAQMLEAVAPEGPAYSKVDATRAAAKRAGCVVLFKGPDTVIAHPDGRCSINAALYAREAPWLATAGAGDVLAGFITGLLARGFAPMQAAETAAWLHVECALEFGPGLIAEDLPEVLPQVLQKLSAP